MVDINYLGVLLAAIANMVLGFLWYGPFFGKVWMKEMGFSKEKIGKMPASEMNKLYVMQAFGSLAMAFVLSHALEFASTYLGTTGIKAGIETGFWNWFGFIAPVTMGSVLWEGKSWKLWKLNNAYYLSALILMGIILSFFS